jgi:hypothetical protein
MMSYLGVNTLDKLSSTIRIGTPDKPTSPTWVQDYRQFIEWAILFSLVREKDFGTDVLIVFDGLLRSKIFAGDLFQKYRSGLSEGIQDQWKKNKRRVYLAGVAKHSQVLTRYRLAMVLENILTTSYPAYLEIPREIEEKGYFWKEYARDDNSQGEANKFVGGKLFFVKFGGKPQDPIWPIDIFTPQANEAQAVIGYMLSDAINGFPVPFYPLCLQKAHENAALVNFDLDILQDKIFESIRNILGDDGAKLDGFRLQDTDPARLRYG